MKKITLSLIFTIGFCSLIFAQSAEEIAAKTKTKNTASSLGSESSLDMQSGGKTLSTLEIRQYSSLDKNGLQRMFVEIKNPPSYKGSRFLMIEKADGTTDQKMYLAQTKKVQKISAQGSADESFMGSDFSNNDISFMERDTKLDNFKILGEEEYEGKSVYLIESTPKDKNYTYSKTIMRITKDKNLLLKAEFYQGSQLVKILELYDYKEVNGIMTAHKTKLSTVKTNTSTIITIKKIAYGMKIPDYVFTQKYLETGKK